MTLLDKFDDALEHSTPVRFAFHCEQIADDFAIGFAEWCRTIINRTGILEYKSKWMNLTTKELLEMYKKEKGL